MNPALWDAHLVWAAIAGAGLAAGALLSVFALPVMNRPQLTERIAPYVHAPGPSRHSANPSAGSLGHAAQIMAPVLNAALRQLDRFSIDSARLSRRLDQAGLPLSVTQYRMQQLIFASAAVGVTTIVLVVAAAAGTFHFLFAAISLAAACGLGIALRDQLLSSRIEHRRARLMAEFPTVTELLALAVSAGETAQGAFDRISRSTRGELPSEMAVTLTRVKTGEPFVTALTGMGARLGVPQISRFLDGVVVAVERGTPLAETLRSQAADARELSKRELMESAGRREIGMLAPVVFGILPLTILFAIYPGLSLLNIGL